VGPQPLEGKTAGGIGQADMNDWIDIRLDERHVAREREKARALRHSDWWRNECAPGICHYCGCQVGSAALTMDHVIPVSRGGTSTRGNVVPACDACNKSKRALTPAEQVLSDLERAGDLPPESEMDDRYDPDTSGPIDDERREEKGSSRR